MRRIQKAEKREKGLILLVFTMVFIVGVGMSFLFYDKSIIMLIVGIFVTILGIVLILKHYRDYFSDHLSLVEILENNPQKVVWVYSVLTQRMPFGFQINQTGTMYFKMIDGNEILLTLPATELKSVSEMLNDKLPHATFGYTKEREQWYIAHPEMLIRGE